MIEFIAKMLQTSDSADSGTYSLSLFPSTSPVKKTSSLSLFFFLAWGLAQIPPLFMLNPITWGESGQSVIFVSEALIYTKMYVTILSTQRRSVLFG